MFFEFACNTFFMAQDGVLEQYKKFGVSKAREEEWRREYISFWVGQLSTDDLKAVDRLRDAGASEALPSLIRMARKGDSYSKLWYGNAIWALANGASLSGSMREEAINAAIAVWQLLVEQAIELSDNHKAQVLPHLRSLDASTPEEYVLNYAKRQLTAARAKGKSH